MVSLMIRARRSISRSRSRSPWRMARAITASSSMRVSTSRTRASGFSRNSYVHMSSLSRATRVMSLKLPAEKPWKSGAEGLPT